MSESEWLASTDPAAMLEWLRFGAINVEGFHGVSARKLRLFACAVARANGHDPVCVSAVEGCVEAGQPDHNFNDREAADRGQFWKLASSVRAAAAAAHAYCGGKTGALLRDVVGSPFRPAVVLPRDLGVVLGRGPRNYRQEDVVSQGWVTPDVLALAEAAYEGRLPDGTLDPARLAVLADALEEAGCLEDSLLMHLRGREPYAECSSCSKKAGTPVLCAACLRNRAAGWMPLRGPHVPGCWAVDLLLGKEAQGG